MAHDVFISFSSGDKAIADAACAILETRRIRCWIAPRDVRPGIPYPQSIMEGIRGSRVLVLILSTRSNTSKHVMREVECAVHSEIPVVPLRIDDSSPTGSLEYLVSSVHWIDALPPPLERHLETLARVVHALLAELRGGETSVRPPLGERGLKAGHPDLAPASPRADSPPSNSDPGQLPKAGHQSAESSKSETSAKSAAVIDAESLARQTEVAARPQDPGVWNQIVGALPKPRNIPRLWLYVGSLLLLAFLGIIIRRATTQPSRDWTNSIGMKFVRIDPGEFVMGTTREPGLQADASVSGDRRSDVRHGTTQAFRPDHAAVLAGRPRGHTGSVLRGDGGKPEQLPGG